MGRRSPSLPWQTFLSRRLVLLGIDYLPSDSSASRKTSGRLCSSLCLPGSYPLEPGCLDPENYSGQAAGLRFYFALKGRAQVVGRMEEGPMSASGGEFGRGQ